MEGMEKLLFGALVRVGPQDGFRARGCFDFTNKESREEPSRTSEKLHRWEEVGESNKDGPSDLVY